MHQIFSNRRLLFLAIILIVSNIVITGISLAIIYNKSIITLENSLFDIVERQKSLITALHDHGSSEQEIISFIKDMDKNHSGIGQLGEFAIAKKTGDSATFLLAVNTTSYSFNNKENHGLPMRLALQGKDGIINAKDYAGIKVFAAYTYVPSLKWGIVAKIPTSEVNQPYYRALLIAILICAVLLSFSMVLFIKISNPIMKSIVDSEEKFRRAIHHAPFPIMIHAEDGEVMDISQGWTDTTGYALSDISTIEKWTERAYGSQQQNIKEYIDTLYSLNGSRNEGEYTIKCNNGTECIWDFSSTPLGKLNDGRRAVISIAKDVTERKKSELLIQEKNNEIEAQNEEYLQINEELNATNQELHLSKIKAEESEKQVRTMFAAANAGIVKIDTNGNLLEWNNTFINYFGYTPEEFKTLNTKDITFPEDIPDSLIYISKTIKKQISNFRIEKRFVRKDKTIFWVDLCGSALEKNDKVYAIMGVVFDITERKKIELQLKYQFNDLIAAKEHAEESDRLKTSFLQNMSHEIRTPMNAIMGFAELLIENYNNKPKLEKFSNIINQRCNDLLDIINDILDIAKIESGQLTVHMENCNLNELFRELASFFTEHQKRIGKDNIKFSIHTIIESLENTIITDKVKLKQIFINLIGNAFKFTDEGKIEIGCKTDANQIVFYVSDTGLGIPVDKQKVIFERFTQLQQNTNHAYGGTGLGLSIVKGLLGLLNGKIWLESESRDLPAGITGGTTFYFSIPYNTSQILLDEPMTLCEPEVSHFQNKTILIVEDDIYNTEYIKEILSNTGLNILHTIFGSEAVQIAASQVPDLVLMDIRLPDMNGYEATQRIKQHNPYIRIIAQTAYAAHDDKQKAKDAGCIDYISKPLKRDALLSIIRKHLSNNNKKLNFY